MTEPMLEIGAEGVDTRRIADEILATVDENVRAGIYADARIARAERLNLMPGAQQGEFLEYYLQCLPEAVNVDIGDFEIHERRARFAAVLVRLKKTIWGLLKFYTYRLWSQQNQVNGMLAAAVRGTDEDLRKRIAALEARLAALEAAGQATNRGTESTDRA
jgi:hypothetical protein